VLHAGAKDPRRRWRSERFAAVAAALAGSGLRIVLTGGCGEAELNADLAASIGPSAVDLSGRTDLGMLAALIARARLVVSNDTGVSHLAAATRTPSVVVFSASDPLRWAPLDGTLHRAVAPRRRPFDAASHCLRDACLKAPWNQPGHMEQVPVTDVLREVARLLDGDS
jgi:ADP-heptose:LPS heptosyltransferase